MKLRRTTLPASPARPPAAFTLVETMVAVASGSLVMAAVMAGWIFTTHSFVAMGNYCDLDQKSRNTLDNMTRDLRGSRVVSFYSTNILTCSNLDGTTFTYGWDPSSQTVYKSSAGSSNVLLTGCTYLNYGIFLRNPTNQAWFPYSATNQPSLTKLVSVAWRCSRTIVGLYNTESVETAKIALRN